jgi:hypothetical protein
VFMFKTLVSAWPECGLKRWFQHGVWTIWLNT